MVVSEKPSVCVVEPEALIGTVMSPLAYSPDYIKLDKTLKQNDIEQFGMKIKKAISGPGGWQIHVDEFVPHGIPMIRISNIKSCVINLDNLRFISEEKHEELVKMQCHYQDIVASVTASLGIIARIPKLLDNCSIYSHLVIFKLKNPDAASLTTFFLNSKYGKFQVDRVSGGSMMQNITVKNYKEILIPEFGIVSHEEELSIENIFSSLYNSIDLSYYLAEAIVQWIPEFTMDYLGIEMPEQSDELCFTVRPDEINEDVEYRLNPGLHLRLRQSQSFLDESSNDEFVQLHRVSDIVKPMFDPRKYPTYNFMYLLKGNVNEKFLTIKHVFQEGKLFTQPKVLVNSGELVVCYRINVVQRIFEVPNHEEMIIWDGEGLVIRTEEDHNYVKALWKTPLVLKQLHAMMEGRINGAITSKYLRNLWLPNPNAKIKKNIAKNYSICVSKAMAMNSLSQTLLKIGTTLLEHLIEAETDVQRSAVTDLLTEITETINTDIFVDDPSQLPDYYDNYCKQEEYDRFITNLPGDYQYDTFEDYKRAGKYIDAEKLAALKEIVDGYAKQVMPPEETEETKIERLVDLIVKVLANKSADLPSILKELRGDYAEAVKPYEIGLEDTVKDALRRHTKLFKYGERFRAWELIDYKRIEEANLQRAGKKQFLEYTKRKADDSEARAPDQQHLVHALIAFLDEGDVVRAREVDALINEKNLVKAERTLYMARRWQMKR